MVRTNLIPEVGIRNRLAQSSVIQQLFRKQVLLEFNRNEKKERKRTVHQNFKYEGDVHSLLQD